MRSMNNFGQKSMVVFLFVFMLVFPAACTNKGPFHRPDPIMEVWELKVEGETVATYRMLLKRVSVEKGVWSISGEFSGLADDHIGGRGMVKCTFHGKIEGHILKADFTGQGDMALPLTLSGILWGHLDDSNGSGEWKVSHEEGQSKGKWVMKRVTKGGNAG